MRGSSDHVGTIGLMHSPQGFLGAHRLVQRLYRPHTNGEAERFIQIVLRECACAGRSSPHRNAPKRRHASWGYAWGPPGLARTPQSVLNLAMSTALHCSSELKSSCSTRSDPAGMPESLAA